MAGRLLQHTAFGTSGIHNEVLRLHLDSPVALRSKVLLLMLTVQLMSPEPLVLVMPEGSLFGCAQASGNPNRDPTLKPVTVVHNWLHLMGVQDEPEHVEESVADTGYTLFSATVAGVPHPDMVVRSSLQLAQSTRKCVWAIVSALEGRPEAPLAQSASTQLSSQTGAVWSSQASTWLDSTTTRVGNSAPSVAAPHYIAQFSSEHFAKALQRDHEAMSLLAAELDNFTDDPMFSDMAQYLAIAKGASADDVELGLQSQVRSFTDRAITAIRRR